MVDEVVEATVVQETVGDKAVVKQTAVEQPAGWETAQDAYGTHWFQENGTRIGTPVNYLIPF